MVRAGSGSSCVGTSSSPAHGLRSHARRHTSCPCTKIRTDSSNPRGIETMFGIGRRFRSLPKLRRQPTSYLVRAVRCTSPPSRTAPGIDRRWRIGWARPRERGCCRREESVARFTLPMRDARDSPGKQPHGTPAAPHDLYYPSGDVRIPCGRSGENGLATLCPLAILGAVENTNVSAARQARGAMCPTK